MLTFPCGFNSRDGVTNVLARESIWNRAGAKHRVWSMESEAKITARLPLQEKAPQAPFHAISLCSPLAGTIVVDIRHHQGGAPTTRAARGIPSGSRNGGWPCPVHTAPKRRPDGAHEPRETPRPCPIRYRELESPIPRVHDPRRNGSLPATHAVPRHRSTAPVVAAETPFAFRSRSPPLFRHNSRP